MFRQRTRVFRFIDIHIGRERRRDEAYDAAGNILTVTDANGRVTVNTYDALNRLTTTRQSPTNDPADDIVVTNEYDAANNRTAVIDGKGRRTEFAYDGLNRNTTIKDPAEREVDFVYDALNKRIRIDSENRETRYTYDARNRLTGVAYVGRSQDDRAYSYDLAGQLLAVTEPGKGGATNVAYTYDALGRQLSETSNGQTHTYAYDLANNRVAVAYASGLGLTSEYDALNRLTMLTEGTRQTAYGYDRAGNRVFLQKPDGSVTKNRYDALNRLTGSVVQANSATLLALTHSYDLVGNLVTVAEAHGGTGVQSRTVTNTYDGVNRLVSEVNVEGPKTIATTYAFDKANNRTAKAVATAQNGATTVVETSYVYNNLNQLQTATTGAAVTSFTYDDNGNRETVSRQSAGTTTGTDTYAYDYENRLVTLTKALSSQPSALSYSYTYDYRTRRVQRTEAGATTSIVFSGGVSVAEYQGGTTSVSSALTAQYIRGSDWGGGVGGLLYSVRSGTPSFKHYNSRGDVVSETNAAGTTTWQGTYEAFGTRTQEVGSSQDRQRANTKEEDPTGLLNEGFRYRCLETGVFITRDPLGFVDGPNLYAYVVQNPWSKFDPEGLKKKQTDWHHELPQSRREDFAKIGIDVDDAKFGRFLDEKDHKVVHGKGGRMEDITKQWDKFFGDLDPSLSVSAKKEAALSFAEQLRSDSTYSKILARGAAIPDGLHYSAYKDLKPDLKQNAIAAAFLAKKEGTIARYVDGIARVGDQIPGSKFVKRVPGLKIIMVGTGLATSQALQAKGFSPYVAYPLAAMDATINNTGIGVEDAATAGEALGEGAVLINDGMNRESKWGFGGGPRFYGLEKEFRKQGLID